MTMRDTDGRFVHIDQIVPQTISSAAINTGDVDLFGYNGALISTLIGTVAELNSGSPTAGSITVKVEHADDDGTGSAGSYSNVAAADISGATPSSGVVFTYDENNVGPNFQCSYVGDKRFIRVTLTPADLDTGGSVSADVFGAWPRHGTAS